MARRSDGSVAAFVCLCMVAGCGARTSLELEAEPDAQGWAGGAPVAPEICNGRDDDGDGLVDEDLGVLSCGIGACSRSVPECVAGELQRCEPGRPEPEQCNGVDDDCDGATDEELGLVRVGGPHTIDESLWYLARSQIVATETGFLVTYATSFDGSHPTPNVRLAPLDPDGIPFGVPADWTSRNMTHGPRLAAAPGGWVATYCGRYGADDRASSALLTADGSFTEHGERSPLGHHCGAGDPDGIWTGERLLFGWTDNSNEDVLLDRATPEGVSVDAALFDDSGDLVSQPRFASNGDRVLMVYGRRDPVTVPWLRVHVLDRSGYDVVDALSLAPPTSPGTWDDAQVVTRPDGGFLVLARNGAGPGLLRARFDAQGALAAGPDVGPAPHVRLDIALAVVARPSGVLAAGNAREDEGEWFGFVAALDADGTITDRWTTRVDPVATLVGWPALVERDGRIFVVYTDLDVPDPDHPSLRVLELGCAG